MCDSLTVRWRRPAAAWNEHEDPEVAHGPTSAAVGLTASALAVVLPALFARGDDFKVLIAVVLSPVLGVLGFVVAPVAAVVGIVFWRRGRRSGERGLAMKAALPLNIAGLSWWIYAAAAAVADFL